jgi:hypothetical protein
LLGYFQNEQYFKHCLPVFAATLHLPRDWPFWKIHALYISVLGDYFAATLNSVELTKHYLPSALKPQRIKTPHVQFMVFSDKIKRCKTVALLQSKDIGFSTKQGSHFSANEPVLDWRHMLKLLLCTVGAYFNPNPARIVTFPQKLIHDKD